jgi:hypothetical protein
MEDNMIPLPVSLCTLFRNDYYALSRKTIRLTKEIYAPRAGLIRAAVRAPPNLADTDLLLLVQQIQRLPCKSVEGVHCQDQVFDARIFCLVVAESLE